VGSGSQGERQLCGEVVSGGIVSEGGRKLSAPMMIVILVVPAGVDPVA
jgi:hypothetical protein